MNIMTFNVGIWTRNRKKDDIFYWKNRMQAMEQMLRDLSPDVICFQELWYPATRYIPKDYRKVFGTGFEHPIYVKKGLHTGIGIFSIHWSMARVEGIRIFSIHGHWDSRKTERLCMNVKNIYAKDTRPAILAGDWNVEYNDLCKHTALLNSARVMYLAEKQDTYIHFWDSSRRGELDHVLMYLVRPKDYEVIRNWYTAFGGRISDHYPIVVTV